MTTIAVITKLIFLCARAHFTLRSAGHTAKRKTRKWTLSCAQVFISALPSIFFLFPSLSSKCLRGFSLPERAQQLPPDRFCLKGGWVVAKELNFLNWSQLCSPGRTDDDDAGVGWISRSRSSVLFRSFHHLTEEIMSGQKRIRQVKKKAQNRDQRRCKIQIDVSEWLIYWAPS